MSEFVSANGTVYHKGVEQPDLKGTRPITDIEALREKRKKNKEAMKVKRLFVLRPLTLHTTGPFTALGNLGRPPARPEHRQPMRVRRRGLWLKPAASRLASQQVVFAHVIQVKPAASSRRVRELWRGYRDGCE